MIFNKKYRKMIKEKNLTNEKLNERNIINNPASKLNEIHAIKMNDIREKNIKLITENEIRFNKKIDEFITEEFEQNLIKAYSLGWMWFKGGDVYKENYLFSSIIESNKFKNYCNNLGISIEKTLYGYELTWSV